MPVHGEAAHLRAHARLAKLTGVEKDHIFICENGESLILENGIVRRGPAVQSGVVFVDGLSVGDTSQDVLDERVALASQGFACASAAVSYEKRKLFGGVKLMIRGMTGGDDAYVLNEAEQVAENAIKKQLAKGTSERELVKIVRDALLSLLWERTNQRPMVIVSLIEI
jgi:ribonuclease J